MRLLPVVLLLAALPATVQAQDAGQPDFTITIAADGTSAIQAGSAAAVSPAGREAGREHRFHLTLTGDYAIGEVRILGALDVQKVRQILPLWRNRTGLTDDHFFGEVPRLDLSHHHLVNFTGTPQDARIRVGLPGPAEKTLVLQRDVRAPDFRVGEPRNITQIGFLLTTVTDEYGFGDLQIRQAGSEGEWIQNPTTIPSLEQTYPVQGLNAATEYEYRIRIWDWPGNEAWSDLRTLTTPAAIVVPPPILTILEPAREAALQERRPAIRLGVESPSPVRTADIRVFFDLQERMSGIEFDGRNATFSLGEDLKRGLHRVTFQVRNVEGGVASETWTFTVGSMVIPSPAWLLALAVAGAALRRR